MKIDRFELYGFLRLSLANITHLIITPTSPYQLILGTNGSGKSSVLSELSPIPAHQSNFTKDGFKKITITHLGKTYQLDSIFKNNKHSFQVDGQELNPGGTREVQKALVLQHFNIDEDIHELLIGEVRFTQLTGIERRKWIQMISRTDYSYAMGLFKRFSSRARDQQGTLKHLRSRLLQETSNLAKLQNTEGLEERSLKIREELNHLMLERIPNLPRLETQKARLRELYDDIESLAKEFFRDLAYQPKGKNYRCNDDIVLDIQRIDGNVQSSQMILERMGNEYGDMEAAMNAVKMEAGESFDNLPELINDLVRESSRLLSSQEVFKELISPSEIQRDWLTIADEVQVTFRQLPDNANRKFSRDACQNAQQEISQHQNRIDVSLSKIRQMQAKIEAMLEAQETQCPNCQYIWRPGYSENELNQLKTWQKEHNQIIDTARLKIKELESYLEELGEYNSLFQKFRGFVQGYPRLRPLWDHILSNQLLFNNPKENLVLFSQWNKDLETNVQHEACLKRLTSYREIQEKQYAIGDTEIFSRRMRKLQDEIEEVTTQLLMQRKDKTEIDRFYRKLQKLQAIGLKIENDYNEIERIRSVLIDALRNEVIDETVTAHQTELGAILRQLSEKENQEGIVRDLERSKVDVEVEAQVMNLLVQALSPNEGLIAEQLASDIGCLVAQLNTIINSIWTYDLTIMSCGMDSGELDYKFPVQTASGGISRDVSKTSKGQKQIIDFAFQLTVMMYLNLTDYPLFLDEPGEGFDEQHRIKLMDFVKQMMDMNRHSQLFMISHYASSHGSFLNAETMVLDGSNISVPGLYNQHVVLG